MTETKRSPVDSGAARNLRNTRRIEEHEVRFGSYQ